MSPRKASSIASVMNSVVSSSAEIPQVPADEQIVEVEGQIFEPVETEAEELATAKPGLVIDRSKFHTMNNGAAPVWRVRFYQEQDANPENMKARFSGAEAKPALSALSKIEWYKSPSKSVVLRQKGGVAINLATIDRDTVEYRNDYSGPSFSRYMLHFEDGTTALITVDKRHSLTKMIDECATFVNKADVWVTFDPKGNLESVSSPYQIAYYNCVVAALFEKKTVFVQGLCGYRPIWRPSPKQLPFMDKNFCFFYNQVWIDPILETAGLTDGAKAEHYKNMVAASQKVGAIRRATGIVAANNRFNDAVVPPAPELVRIDATTEKVVCDTLEAAGVLSDGCLDWSKMPAGKAVWVYAIDEDGVAPVTYTVGANERSDSKAFAFMADPSNAAKYTYQVHLA